MSCERAESAIVPVIIGDEAKLKSMLRDLMQAGVVMNYVASFRHGRGQPMRLTPWWIGGILLATGLVSCTPHPAPVQAGPVGAAPASDALAQRVAKDALAVLQEGLDRYNKDVTTYTCTLYKQERLDPKGTMGPEQKMNCKFMGKPFSVFADAVANPIGAKKILYIEGQWDNKMLVQPSGVAGILGSLLIDPHGSQAMADTLQPIDQFGFKKGAEKLIHSYQLAHKEGILTVKVLGADTVGGRAVVVCEVKIAEPKPTGRFDYPRVRVSLDREWLLPIAVDTWDADGIERGHYKYTDVNFKANLTAKDFLPEANGLKSPK
jgi:hypothetical protein